ncbi:hypothetical protein MTsPCn5_14060 [Croceitalea sp. MTPC5]|uniref:GIN domain-containing protein n=1 Tax=Croceitalea sp. MTPC5 TaxID=3056565 RepID=UPI002B3D8959|nr:hypothetical protein MTsPCn5_14060 [Croceitalea sp. MTPC5]
MKKIFLLSLLCVSFVSTAQRRPKIKGNREVTEVREELPPFNAVELNDNLSIVLKKSFGEGYEIIADDNLIDVLKFKVVDSTLVISSFYDITAKKKLGITVNFRELKAITMRDGKIDSEDILNSDELFINVFGPSKLDVEVNAFIANINLEDTSTANFNLDVDSVNVSMKHKADARLYGVSGAKNIELANNATLDIEGTTDKLILKLVDDTKFRGEKLQTQSASLQIEGSPLARIYATMEFELQSSGDAKTYLYGEPKITILDFLDTSQLIKKKN